MRKVREMSEEGVLKEVRNVGDLREVREVR
jgi:hypothetical protein